MLHKTLRLGNAPNNHQQKITAFTSNSFSLLFLDHYRIIADRYDYFYKEFHKGVIPVLMECLDLKPGHVVADIGSGTGTIAKELYELSGLENPIWCVDPSVEMQEVARQKKGVYTVLKTAEEFFSDSQISESFDRVIAIISAHHFNSDIAFKRILRSLRPSGIFFLVTTLKSSLPIFKSAKEPVSQSLEEGRKSHFSFLNNLNAKVSQQEFSYSASVTKSKLYEMFRGRFISLLKQFSDDQIEEGIRELENDAFKNMKDGDLINFEHTLLVIRAEKDE